MLLPSLVALLFTAQVQAQVPAMASTESFHFDYMRTKDRVESDGRIQRTVEIRVRLRTPQAVNDFGRVSIPYVKDYGDVAFNSVRVFKPDGSSRAVSDGVLEDLNPFGINDASVPVDVRVKNFTIPRLEPGDTLAYAMVVTHRPFVEGQVSGEMKFTPVPVDGPQTYELDIPAGSSLSVRLRPDLGASWENVPGEAGRLVRRLSLDVPPLVVKAPGTTEAQRIALQTPDVSFTTFPSWSAVSSWWWSMSRTATLPDAAVEKEAERLAAGKTTAAAKLDAFAQFVGQTIRYLNVSFGMGRMRPREAPSVLSSRYGDCKDKVALLMALAAKQGIPVRPALISVSRMNLEDDSPGPHQFDHMIAVAMLGPAEKDWVWLDVTNAMQSPALLVPVLRDRRALIIGENGEAVLVRTPARPPLPTRRAIDTTGALDASGAFKGHIRLTDTSDVQANLRSFFGAASPEQRVELIKGVGSTWKDATLTNVRSSDPADLSLPFSYEFDFERAVPGIDTEKDWKFWIPDLGALLMDPEGVDSTAKRPILFVASEISVKASIELPEGVAARAPLSVTLSRPFASVTSNYTVDGRTLKLDREVRFPNHSIAAEELSAYATLYKAAETDRKQEFTIGPFKLTGEAASAALQKQGKAAWNQKDFPRALELLEKAAAANPKLPGIQADLGLALRDADKHVEAIAAFTRAIETNPFHESAYADRAYSLFELDRDDEAERDLLKQIEVAPFKDWSYARLARVRDEQERYLDAADLYMKALAIDGTNVGRWLEAGWSNVRGGKPEEAKRAYEKGRALGLKAPQRVQAAFGYRMMGDLKTAASLAQDDLADLSKNVALITPKNMSSSYLYWVRRLAQAWMIIGEAALEEKDLPKAEKFLKASWELGFLPNAAYSLGRIAEDRGQVSQALEFWSAAVVLKNWEERPKDLGERLGRLRKGGDMLSDGSREMARLRFIKIPGEATVDAQDEILVLASGGKVTGAINSSKKKEAELAPALTRLIGQPLPVVSPKGTPQTVLRTGTLACKPRSGCQFIAKVESSLSPPPIDVGSIHIVKMSPADRATIAVGQAVHLVLSASYDLTGSEPGVVGLMVGARPEELLVNPPPSRAVQPGKGTVDFDVTFTTPKAAKDVRVIVLLSTRSAPTRTMATAQFSVRP